MKYDYRSKCAVVDIEVYRNYFLIAFRSVENPEKTRRFEMRNDNEPLDIVRLKKMLRAMTIITFNGNHYDVPIILLALEGATCSELKDASDAIIKGKQKPWDFLRERNLSIPAYLDHIDIFEIPQGARVGLKAYSARAGFKKLQDLPIEESKILTAEEMDIIAEYCDNDTANTRDLFLHDEIKPRVDFRCELSRQYNMDLRSKSDAQLGEAVFKYVIEQEAKQRFYKPDFGDVRKVFKYDIPDFLHFENRDLQKLCKTLKTLNFYVNPKNGHVILPEELEDKIVIGNTTYTIGIGGLHSNESEQAIVARDDEDISDIDAGSFYPSIIIDGGYYPSQLGKVFLRIFRKFRDDRLAWKHDAAKALVVAIYKIILNGTFGKLSSRYSFLYSPKMLVQVTLTGQLSLLMLIERLEAAGLRVVSANTDGIVVHSKKSQRETLHKIVSVWEVETSFIMEYTQYAALYSQSVNSYLALKPDGKWKRKGDYSERCLAQSGGNQVCIDAVMTYLQYGTPLRETIEQCEDFLQFTNFQQVKMGAYKDGEYLGKVVRWYYSTSTDSPILNAKGGKVPLTQGAMPCMELPETFPHDMDYDWYVREAHKMLDNLGVKGVLREAKAFGLVEGKKPRYGKKEGQKTWHLVDLATKDALCGATLADRHDTWEYSDTPQGIKCRKCENARK